MPKPKKTKKKYTPRPVYYPQIMTKVNSFGPFEAAMDKLIETGEVELDENGHYVYHHTDKTQRSFESDLYLYARFAELYCESKGLKVDTEPLWKLRESMLAKGDLDFKEIQAMQTTLEICKKILMVVNPIESRNILSIISKEVGLTLEY